MQEKVVYYLRATSILAEHLTLDTWHQYVSASEFRQFFMRRVRRGPSEMSSYLSDDLISVIDDSEEPRYHRAYDNRVTYAITQHQRVMCVCM